MADALLANPVEQAVDLLSFLPLALWMALGKVYSQTFSSDSWDNFDQSQQDLLMATL